MRQILNMALFIILSWGGLFDVQAQNITDSLSTDSNKEYAIEEVTVVGKHTPSEIIPAQVLFGQQPQKLNTMATTDQKPETRSREKCKALSPVF